jgi:hypothetical protein
MDRSPRDMQARLPHKYRLIGIRLTTGELSAMSRRGFDAT